MRKGLIAAVTVCVLSLLVVPSLWAEVVRGKITAMDAASGKLSVQTASGEPLALTFDKEDFIVWKGDDEVEAKEIQIGSDAEVGYYADENGAKIASWVDLTPVEATEESSASMEEMGGASEAAAPMAEEEPVMTQPEPGTEQPAAMEPSEKEQGN